jgi:hypothetical protein
MNRVRSALNLMVLLGAVLPAVGACQGMSGLIGLLVNTALAVGVSVGVYYLTQELK